MKETGEAGTHFPANCFGLYRANYMMNRLSSRTYLLVGPANLVTKGSHVALSRNPFLLHVSLACFPSNVKARSIILVVHVSLLFVL
jgi:hypothetical protein